MLILFYSVVMISPSSKSLQDLSDILGEEYLVDTQSREDKADAVETLEGSRTFYFIQNVVNSAAFRFLGFGGWDFFVVVFPLVLICILLLE